MARLPPGQVRAAQVRRRLLVCGLLGLEWRPHRYGRLRLRAAAGGKRRRPVERHRPIGLLDHLEARTARRAPERRLSGLDALRPPQPASGRPTVEEAPLNTGSGALPGLVLVLLMHPAIKEAEART